MALVMGVVWIGARGFEEGVEVVVGRLELSSWVWLTLGDRKVVAEGGDAWRGALCMLR